MFETPIGASVPGGVHLEEQINCHDFHFKGQLVANSNHYFYGFILDGMGAGQNSEVGAKTGGMRLESLIVDKLTCPEYSITEDNFSQFTQTLYKGMLDWLQAFIALHQPLNMEDFILNYLLFSIIGFVISPEITLIIRSDDGMADVNGKVYVWKSDTPKYIGLHTLPISSPWKRKDIPLEFEVDAYYTRSINRLLIASDGLHDIIPSDIWKVTSDGALHRKLVALQRMGRLKDDGSIVKTERRTNGPV